MKKLKPVPLIPFGCVHIGHKNADMGMLKRYIKFVKKHNAYVILVSDTYECAVPRKGHMMMDQCLTPQEQLDMGCELLYPIKDNIVGSVSGNHTARARKDAGLDMDKITADRLGYPYNQFQGFVTLAVGKVTYKIAFKHGNGSGSDTFRNAKTLRNAFPTSDICITSHTHQLTAGHHGGYWDIVNGKRSLHPIWYVSTGSLLDFPTYADEAYYDPQPKGFPILWLYPYERKVIPDISGII